MKTELGVQPLASYGLTEVRRLGAWFGLGGDGLGGVCVARWLHVPSPGLTGGVLPAGENVDRLSTLRRWALAPSRRKSDFALSPGSVFGGGEAAVLVSHRFSGGGASLTENDGRNDARHDPVLHACKGLRLTLAQRGCSVLPSVSIVKGCASESAPLASTIPTNFPKEGVFVSLATETPPMRLSFEECRKCDR